MASSPTMTAYQMTAAPDRVGMNPVSLSAIFVDCLKRNGVVAQDVEVTLDADSSVASIGARQEGDVAYEPSVRLACTEEGKDRTP